MRLAEVAVQHGTHDVAAGDENGAVRLGATVVKLEGNVAEEVLVDEVLLQVGLDFLFGRM